LADVWQAVKPQWERQQVVAGRRRATRLHPTEIMTILILIQQSNQRTFKHCYIDHV
jgi:hypothetical protein